jgi:pentalenolactone synthase
VDVTALVQLPFEQAGPLQAAPRLRALQAQGPIHEIRTETGDPAWLVTGYEEVRRLLADPRLGRSHPDPGHTARTGESVLFGGPLGNYETEQAEHARMRSLLQPHFTPGRMRALRPRVEALTAGLLDELACRDQPADLIQVLAVPLPILVICELLGVPYEDRSRFRAWTRAAGDVRDRSRSEQGLADLFGLWLTSASTPATTSSPACALPTGSATMRSRCGPCRCCSPGTRRPSSRSAWAR